MNNYSFNHGGKTYNRVTRATAKRAFEKGLDVVIACRNIRPFNNPWNTGYNIMNKEDDKRFFDAEPLEYVFDRVVNQFEYYNCNSETGYYAAFYLMEGVEA